MPSSAEPRVTLADIVAARNRIGASINRTPCAHAQTLSELHGTDVYLKFENQQFTASFKERGALNRLLALSDAERRRGVIAMSAGNHAQAVAYHGKRLGIPTTIVMPRFTPNTKVEQTRSHDAEVILEGTQFDETREFAERLAQERQLMLIHPFDDAAVIAGQGTVGLEILEQVPEVDTVIVPIGGGGLISGVATAIKAQRPQTRIIGVQTERYAPVYAYFGGGPTEDHPGTIAEGIAVKQPGQQTLAIIDELVDGVVAVSEAAIEQAVFTFLEIEKTVTEGAGAAALAALMTDPGQFQGQRTVLVVSGGNIDMMTLSSVILRSLGRSHRLVRLGVTVPDVPGALADITRVLGEMQSNIVDIEHRRAFGTSSVRDVGVEMLLEMRGEEQEQEVIERLAREGFAAERRP